ncbi:hypothetical protein LINPERHAP2_LOCUS18822 [Linum perenne]
MAVTCQEYSKESRVTSLIIFQLRPPHNHHLGCLSSGVMCQVETVASSLGISRQVAPPFSFIPFSTLLSSASSCLLFRKRQSD